MSRLPAYFHEGYLDDDAHRYAGVVAELARGLDELPADEPHELRGLLVQLENPRELAAAAGPIVTSVVPAALDEVVRRLASAPSATILTPFSIYVVGVERGELVPALGRFRRLLQLALADFLDAMAIQQSGEKQAGAELLAEDVLSMTSPRLRVYDVRFVFAAGGEKRGASLMDYVLRQRNLLDPGEWPATVSL